MILSASSSSSSNAPSSLNLTILNTASQPQPPTTPVAPTSVTKAQLTSRSSARMSDVRFVNAAYPYVVVRFTVVVRATVLGWTSAQCPDGWKFVSDHRSKERWELSWHPQKETKFSEEGEHVPKYNIVYGESAILASVISFSSRLLCYQGSQAIFLPQLVIIRTPLRLLHTLT